MKRVPSNVDWEKVWEYVMDGLFQEEALETFCYPDSDACAVCAFRLGCPHWEDEDEDDL